MARRDTSDVQFHDLGGLQCWRGRPGSMPAAHIHTDIEWNLILEGSITYLLAGRLQTIPRGRLAVLWAGVPHRLVERAPQTKMAWLTLPLPWFLDWQLDKSFTRHLLRGHLVLEPDASAFARDDEMLARWATDLKDPSSESRRIVTMEVEARLRRLARAVGARAPSRAPSAPTDAGHLERLARAIGERYREPDVSVQRLADTVGLHPNYAMNLFKRGSGMSLWEYLTRVRVSHAQRLLLTTDWKIARIAIDSGFVSASRFYDAFQRVCAQTPRAYRIQKTRG